MSIDKIFVSLFGFVLMGLIYWFFFGKKDEAVVVKDKIEILVEGGYKPSVIKIKKGTIVKLLILRKDSNSCLEEIVIPDFKVKKYLPLNEVVEIELKPEKIGTFVFHCGMNMFHGKIIVE